MLVTIKKYKFYIIKTKFYRFIIKLKKLSVGITRDTYLNRLEL